MRLPNTIAAALFALVPAGAMASTCAPAVDPVLGLAFDSRYAQEDDSRSEIVEAREEAAEDALRPLDTFIRDLAGRLDEMYEIPADDAVARMAAATCLLSVMADWAEADALAHLETQTVRLTIDSRLAAMAIIAGRARAELGHSSDAARITAWLTDRVNAQMVFWETGPDRAGQNNLRAWAALAAAATARLNDDRVMQGWAAWSVSYIACSANPDGSLPQEMTRGRLALHYQLHAVAPLVSAAAILEETGMPMLGRCNDALRRIAAFTLRDIQSGEETAEITGEVQSFFDGSDTLESFQLAWLEPWLTLVDNPQLEEVAEALRPLSYSKLGGNQTALWGG